MCKHRMIITWKVALYLPRCGGHGMSRNLTPTYCWWLKSCTTWDVWNPIHNGIFIIATGARISSINSITTFDRLEACISLLPVWRSVPARRRFRVLALQRPKMDLPMLLGTMEKPTFSSFLGLMTQKSEGLKPSFTFIFPWVFWGSKGNW